MMCTELQHTDICMYIYLFDEWVLIFVFGINKMILIEAFYVPLFDAFFDCVAALISLCPSKLNKK